MIKLVSTSLARVLSCAAIIYLAIVLLLFALQDLLIFPALKLKFSDQQNYNPVLPTGVYSYFATTADGERLEVRTNFSGEKIPNHAAIIFHGNGETVEQGHFLPFFSKLGVAAFTFDYRGFGQSSGWPSESGIYLDAEAVWESVRERTKITPERLTILGNSVGTAPASYLAQKIKSGGLILLGAYPSLPDLVAEMPLYAPFRFVLRYHFPTTQYLQGLGNTCVILAHGKLDTIIPLHHLATVRASLPTGIVPTLIEAELAGHNDLYWSIEDQLISATERCIRLL